MPRFFTLLQAESLLPQVEGLLRTLIQLKQDHDRADAELSRMSQRIALSGGMIVRREQVQQVRARKDACAQSLKTAVEKIQEIGCELKDIETGLVDFPTVYRGKEVYLCWKLGESGISFWQHIEDGYRGRQPIDSEFLTHHNAG